MEKGILFSFIPLFALILLSSACSQTANHNAAMNHNSMDHDSMPVTSNTASNSNMPVNHSAMKSDINAASAPFDLQFIDTMTHHHKGAVEMSEAALKKSSNEDLKKFAQKVIDEQTEEIAQMRDWREKWFGENPSALNMEMPGMKDSMKMMAGEAMKKFEASSGKEFDLMFLDMMTDHHKGATTMAKDALTKAERPEIKTLAGKIIKAQDEEIKKMSAWKSQWSK